MSRNEELLTALVNGTGIENFVPSSRAEQILLCCINKHGIEHCESPKSNMETLLQALAVDIQNGYNVPAEVATEQAMMALLVAANVGKAYKYTGTTGTYTNGDIYVVEEGA